MAINAKNSRVCACILMILVSLGLAVCLSLCLPSFNRSDLPQKNTHEIFSLEEARSSYENEIKNSIQSMLNTWLGADNAKVSVHADMDFSQKEQTQELLDLDNPALSKAAGDDVEYTYSKQMISSSSKSGQVKHLSIAVLLDQQKLTISDSMRADITRLVEHTAGFDVARGDSLEIIETSFAPVPFFSNMSIWQPSLFIFVLLFVLFGVVMIRNGQMAGQIEPPPAVLPAFTNPAVVNSVAMSSAVEGQITPNALKKAQDLIQAKPEETLTLLRGWLCQGEGEVNES
ncbi:MAG: hypothetical protein J6P93_01600 [Alphaproteobacteria bacterium]|nr:hypothetical protein [Alphaproteobacteria bacterium]